MVWSSPENALSRLLSGDPLSILIAFAVSISLPILLHLFLYRSTSKAGSATPTFLLLGTVGAGKTSLFTLFQQHRSLPRAELRQPPLTRTSQISHKTNISLLPTVPLGSNKYRSENDTSLQQGGTRNVEYRLIDTPGHGKLRAEQALPHLEDQSLIGIIYVVDAASFDSDSDGDGLVKDSAAYLHDVLLHLQTERIGKRPSSGSRKRKKRKVDTAILIAANKQDLFEALPPGSIRERLQSGIEIVRQSKRASLGDVGDEDRAGEEDEDGLLFSGSGGSSEEPFTFKKFEEEYGIKVEVIGGEARGEDAAGRGIEKWEFWIGQQL